jgi:hypothetical protein
MNPTLSKILAHLLGYVLWFGIAIGVSIAYVLIVTRVFGVTGGPFGLAAALFSFPLMIILFAVVIWLPFWLFHRFKWGKMSHGRAFLFGLLGGLLLSIFIAGPRGFTLAGGSELVNYALTAGVMLGAVVHNAVAERGYRVSQEQA